MAWVLTMSTVASYCPGTFLIKYICDASSGDYFSEAFSLVDTGVCDSTCAAGTYAVCSTAELASGCFATCPCASCPAGTASTAVGALDSSVCVACATGQASSAGASACSSCDEGFYATDSATDTGGGLTAQVLTGATTCNPCPVGFFAASPSTIVCQVRPILFVLACFLSK